MRKILLILFAFFVAEMQSSCSRNDSAKPASTRLQVYATGKSDVGSGD